MVREGLRVQWSLAWKRLGNADVVQQCFIMNWRTLLFYVPHKQWRWRSRRSFRCVTSATFLLCVSAVVRAGIMCCQRFRAGGGFGLALWPHPEGEQVNRRRRTSAARVKPKVWASPRSSSSSSTARCLKTTAVELKVEHRSAGWLYLEETRAALILFICSNNFIQNFNWFCTWHKSVCSVILPYKHI